MSYTKAQRRQLDETHRLIVQAHRAGVCDKDGRSVTNEQGVMAALPSPVRSREVVTLHVVGDRVLIDRRKRKT